MRLDLYLVERLNVKSRSRAAELIKSGKVSCDGRAVLKPAFDVSGETDVVLLENDNPYVGRGALKLAGALDSFGIDPEGAVCIDVGASTGGFTEVLLRRGACRVYAVDSGHGQLDPTVASDSRVVSLEGFNARLLSPETLPEKVSLAVCDVSFISQTLLHAAIRSVMTDGGVFVSLVKPQFELTRASLAKGGIVRRASDRFSAAERVYRSLTDSGFSPSAFISSPITGGDGNHEYFIMSQASSALPTLTLDEIERIITDER